MNKELEIRMARLDDAEQILEIYRHYVENTTITFEYVTPSLYDFKARMIKTMERFPYLVCVLNCEVIGFAYASNQKERAAYQWNAELSVYIKNEHQAQGIGTALYQTIIGILKKQGFANVYAVIAHPNERSEEFHKKLGFKLYGIAHKTGWKFGSWIDVAEMELRLIETNTPPIKITLHKSIDKMLKNYKPYCTVPQKSI